MAIGEVGLLIRNAQKPVELAASSGRGTAQILLQNLLQRTALEMPEKQNLAMTRSARYAVFREI
jgi:hypothetical protein